MSSSARTLELLSVLASRPSWPGRELADRVGVSPRTLRRDITALQDLGYPITSERGVAGGYRLAPGAVLPPLVMTDEEAVTIVLALGEAAASRRDDQARSAVSALEKLVGALPARLRQRIEALDAVTSVHTPLSSVPVDVSVLTTVAMAARESRTLEVGYGDRGGRVTRREVQPHGLVTFEGRIYLIAYDLLRQDWRLFRLDRVASVRPTGQTFARRALPHGDPVEFLRAGLADATSTHRIRATVHAPASRVAEALGEHGNVTPAGPDRCEVVMTVDRLDWVAFGLGSLGAPFEVHGPEEARRHLRAWGERFVAATDPSLTGPAADATVEDIPRGQTGS